MAAYYGFGMLTLTYITTNILAIILTTLINLICFSNKLRKCLAKESVNSLAGTSISSSAILIFEEIWNLSQTFLGNLTNSKTFWGRLTHSQTFWGSLTLSQTFRGRLTHSQTFLGKINPFSDFLRED